MQREDLAIIWDMDGTILDTKTSHYITYKETLAKYGYTLDRDVFDANFGRNNLAILPLFLGIDPEPALKKRLTQEKEAYFRQVAPKNSTLVLGVKSWIKTAKAKHIPQVIASSAELENIKTLLAAFDLLCFFEVIIPGDDKPPKPQPDIFLKAAKALNKPPEHCLVIEDSPAGIKAAKSAGMTAIAVTSTFPDSDLTLADLVISDFRMPLGDALRKLDIL